MRASGARLRDESVSLLTLSFGMLSQVVASAIVDKYIGESARLIREMFGCVMSCV